MRSVFVASLILVSLAGPARAQEPGRRFEPPPLATGHYALLVRVVPFDPDRPKSRAETTLVSIERRRGGLWAVSRPWKDGCETPPFQGPGEATPVGAPAPADQVPEGEETLWFGGAALPCVRSAARSPDGSTRREWRCPKVAGALVRAVELDPKGELRADTQLMLVGPWRAPPRGLRAAPGQWTLHRETSSALRSGATALVRRWVEERGGALWHFEQEIDDRGVPLDEARAWKLSDPDRPRRLGAFDLSRAEIFTWQGIHLRCQRVVRHCDAADFLLLSDAVPLGGVVEERGPTIRSTLQAWGVDGPRSTSTPQALPTVGHDAQDLVRSLGARALLSEVSHLVRYGGSVRVERGKLLVQETTLGQAHVRERLQTLRLSPPQCVPCPARVGDW